MSILGRLVRRAIYDELDNNQIRNYKITSQHGKSFVYHIYNVHDHDSHICTITINDSLDVIVKDTISCKDIERLQIFNTLDKMYDNTIYKVKYHPRNFWR